MIKGYWHDWETLSETLCEQSEHGWTNTNTNTHDVTSHPADVTSSLQCKSNRGKDSTTIHSPTHRVARLLQNTQNQNTRRIRSDPEHLCRLKATLTFGGHDYCAYQTAGEHKINYRTLTGSPPDDRASATRPPADELRRLRSRPIRKIRQSSGGLSVVQTNHTSFKFVSLMFGLKQLQVIGQSHAALNQRTLSAIGCEQIMQTSSKSYKKDRFEFWFLV